MRQGKVGLVLVMVFSLVLGLASASTGDQQPRWRKSLFSHGTTSSLLVNRVGSSILFPVHGNVHPYGYVCTFMLNIFAVDSQTFYFLMGFFG